MKRILPNDFSADTMEEVYDVLAAVERLILQAKKHHGGDILIKIASTTSRRVNADPLAASFSKLGIFLMEEGDTDDLEYYVFE